MSEVFLSYRQTDEAQRERVRAFGERLRDAGITVILDQFFLDEHPAGPNDGWPKWSSDRALKTQYVLIIGTLEWFQCFEKNQPPGIGLGAACEADDLRTRIFESNGIVENIRVVLFDDSDAAHIPGKLRPYHRFHAERDFTNIVRWLGGKLIIDAPRTSIPHNLPSLQPFFGREEELKKIADALDPESRTWGALIDGPGGMGKTSLAVRAAYDASAEDFDKIVFVSLKSRELDDDGVRDLSGFLISGLAELLNDLARQLGQTGIEKSPEERRPRLILDALGGTRTLLILDNLESLLKRERDVVFNFVKRLPPGCKAILTSRGRIGSAAEELILERLTEVAALATIAKLAESNPTLAKTRKKERLALYRETGGNPLLLRWTAGQIGRGSCITLTDAIAYLRSCPEGNDPLEFTFGDLVEDFSEPEMRVLCALTYFTLPAKAAHICEVSECASPETDRALRSLVNRSLVVPSEELKTFTLVPLVTDFLRKKKPEIMTETHVRLMKRAYALLVENGFKKYERFQILDEAWPTVAASLPRFLSAPNDVLRTVCTALLDFLDFTGRWDELLALSCDAEAVAITARDFWWAGWHAFNAGWIHSLRRQSAEVLTCVDRAEDHWRQAETGPYEKAAILHLRAVGLKLADNYSAAIAQLRESIALSMNLEPTRFASDLNELGDAERLAGDFDAADRDYREALRVAEETHDPEGVAAYSSNLAQLALDRHDWVNAEALSREALQLADKIGRQDLIAGLMRNLAVALLRQEKSDEALPYARSAVQILTRLGSPDLEYARTLLAQCEP